jgi:plastocyanin
MERRRFLASVGAVSVLAGAGCAQAPEEGPGEDGGANRTTETTETTAANESAGNETGNDAGNATDAGGGEGGGATVQMVTEDDQNYFDPIGLFVEPGQTVTWVNEAGAHSSTAYAESNDAADVTRIPEDAEPWNSGTLSEEGATFEHAPETTGTYDYFCVPHKSLEMVGRLVVGEPGGVEGDPPDGSLPAPQDVVDQGSISYDEFSG